VDSVAIYVRRGRTYLKAQEYSRAIAPLSQAVRLDSQSAEAQDLLGLVYAFRLEPGKAIEHIDKAIAIKPENGTYYMHLGKAYMLKTDYVGATAAYERAIELGLKKGKPHYDLGIIAEREGRLEDARSRFREAIKVAPRFAPSCNLQLGIIAEKLGDEIKAIGLYSRALTGNPNLTTGHYRIALLYLNGGREELAEKHLEHFRRLKAAKGQAME
jgi:tetratricopeptide (TPR) repeat protein